MQKMLASIGVAVAVAVWGGAVASARGAVVFSMTDQVASEVPPAPLGGFGSVFVDTLSDFSDIVFGTSSAANQNAALPGDMITIGAIAFGPSNLNTSTLVNFDLPFDYRVTLTDAASGATGTFDLTGSLYGSETASPVSITSNFKNLALSTSTLTLGANQYSITGGTFAGPTGNGTGVIQLLISVPEPIGGVFAIAPALLLRRRERVVRQ